MKKTFTVNRKRWVRGGNLKYGDSKLLNYNNYMCCVGFFSKEILGLENKEIKCKSYLAHRGNKYVVSEKDTKGFQKIYDINDDSNLDDDKREVKLKQAFKKLGYNIQFKG